MKKTLKHLFSLFAVFAFVFAIGTEAMAAKAGKTLKKTLRKISLSAEFLKVYLDFLMQMHQETGLV